VAAAMVAPGGGGGGQDELFMAEISPDFGETGG
jgi:hypothetical protein